METKAEQAFADLRARVLTLPVPAAPPRHPSFGSSIGIGLLNVALNLNHLSRMSERLTFVDRMHLGREVQIHVSLDRLTPDQYGAAANYGKVRQWLDHRHGPDGRRDPQDQPPDGVPLVWVPVDRLSRTVVAPLLLHDSEGREVPRATQPELLPVINAAMYVLLRLELETDPRVQDTSPSAPESSLHELLYETNRARWLLEHAVADTVNDRSGVLRGPAGARSEPDASVRSLALTVLDKYLNQQRHEAFYDLLWHAASEYLVVAGLNPLKQEHYLTYQAPALGTADGSVVAKPVRRYLRGLLPGRELTVAYQSLLPRNLNSYHVALETEPGVRVREAIMVTENERPVRDELHDDLCELAEAIERRPAPARARYLAYEVSDAFFRLARFAGDRRRDLRTHRAYCARRQVEGSEDTSATATKLQQIDDLARHHRDGRPVLDTSWEGLPDTLRRAAILLDSLDLERDLVVDDDPRDNAAHLYWRRPAIGSGPVAPSTTRATVHVVLADDPPSLSGSVVLWLAALLALVVALGWLLYDGFAWLWSPWASPQPVATQLQADALIAVLLIVPGVVLSRLDLPRTSTVAGQLNFLDRCLGQAAVVVAGAVGLTLAVRGADDATAHHAFWTGMAALAVLWGVALVDRVLSRYRRSRLRVMVVDSPRWLWPPLGPVERSRRWLRRLHRRARRAEVRRGGRTPDARFDSLPSAARPAR